MPAYDLEFAHYLRATAGPSIDVAVVAGAQVTQALRGPRRYRIKNVGVDPCVVRVFPATTPVTFAVAATDQVLNPGDYFDQWVGTLNNYDSAKDGPSVIHARCYAPAVATTLRVTEISRP